MGYKIKLTLLTIISYVFLCWFQTVFAATPPYPQSQVIENISWDFSNLVRLAPGSDLWPVTWASDGNLYTSWGDGGGFGGTNSDGRVSLGFARIEGFPGSFTGYNVWGGKNPENPATFSGKASGMLSIGNTIYAWANAPQISPVSMKIIWSNDFGATWQQVDWRFGETDTLRDICFLNFGKAYADARDNYVYSYALEQVIY
jgi:hypothetical protein